MKALLFPIIIALLPASLTLTAVADGDAPVHAMPPLKLSPQDQEILGSVNKTEPRNATDYYFSLSSSFFGTMDSKPENRVTFIDKDSLTDIYLAASHVPEKGDGGFSLTIRVFPGGDSPLVAITTSRNQPKYLLGKKDSGPGQLQSVTVGRPELWRNDKGKWIRQNGNLLPTLPLQDVLDRYRHHYKAHLEHMSRRKSISLDYILPPTGDIVEVTGRENFMDPKAKYVWASYRFDGTKFVPVEGGDTRDGN